VALNTHAEVQPAIEILHLTPPPCVTILKRGIDVSMSPRKKSTGKNKPDEVFIPDKLYFRIGEVATLCRLPAYVLRFWESEFPQLKPVKSSTGQRMYRRRDVESVLRIKQLLYEQGFTIVGARQQLRSETKADKGQAAIPFPAQSSAEIQHIRQGLREILNLLSTRKTG
jgi:DNA-binding transcriptional MerR regulator